MIDRCGTIVRDARDKLVSLSVPLYSMATFLRINSDRPIENKLPASPLWTEL
jgi:hypothetical protein